MKAGSLSGAVAQGSCVERLAQFFPGAIPVRIPVRVARKSVQVAGAMTGTSAENTVIEFGTPHEVLFASGLGLDFEDRVHLESPDGSLVIEAEVVALQLHHGQTAVAARFLKKVSNWIIKQ